MRIIQFKKTYHIPFESIIIGSYSWVIASLVAFIFIFLFFSYLSDIFIIIFHIPDVYATLDTFSARGTLFIHIDDSISNIDTKTQLLSSSSLNQSTTSINNNNNIDNTNIITPTTNPTTNTNSTITKEQNAISIIKSIKGKWNLKINKGSPTVFDMLLVSYDQNGVPKNAYGIYNLRDNKFIQLDNRGNEIINGKVDLRSVGEVNKTITDIDATLIIERLQNIQLIVNNENAMSIPNFFNKPLIGKIILMADGIGKILVDKRPKASLSSSVPIPPSDATPTPPPNLPPYTHRQPNSSPQTSPNSPNAVPPDSKLPPPALNTPDTKIR